MHDAAYLGGHRRTVLALAAAIHGGGVRIWSGLVRAAAIGSGFSMRQLWLQSLPPDEVPPAARACRT